MVEMDQTYGDDLRRNNVRWKLLDTLEKKMNNNIINNINNIINNTQYNMLLFPHCKIQLFTFAGY
jgi:hypothetical protein